MIPTRIQGDFSGWVTAAVMWGCFFFFFLFSFVFSASALPCTLQARQVCSAIWIWVSHYMPGWLQKAGMPQELRAGDQKVALFPFCRAGVLLGCSGALGWRTAPGVSAAQHPPGPEHSWVRSSYFPSRKWMAMMHLKAGWKLFWGELLKLRRVDFKKMLRSSGGRGSNFRQKEVRCQSFLKWPCLAPCCPFDPVDWPITLPF